MKQLLINLACKIRKCYSVLQCSWFKIKFVVLVFILKLNTWCKMKKWNYLMIRLQFCLDK